VLERASPTKTQMSRQTLVGTKNLRTLKRISQGQRDFKGKVFLIRRNQRM
jgi:hypothetical protein